MKLDLWTTIHCNSYGSSSQFGLILLFVYRNPTLVKKGIPRSWAQLLASKLMSFVWFLKAYIKNQTVIYLSSEGIPETPSYHKPITPRFAHLTFCPLLNTGSDTSCSLKIFVLFWNIYIWLKFSQGNALNLLFLFYMLYCGLFSVGKVHRVTWFYMSSIKKLKAHKLWVNQGYGKSDPWRVSFSVKNLHVLWIFSDFFFQTLKG